MEITNRILQASQALSAEIVLSSLLRKIMDTVMEHVDADRAVLIEQQENEWVMLAEKRKGDGVKISPAIVPDPDVTNYSEKRRTHFPLSIVNTVAQRREKYVINDTSTDDKYHSGSHLHEIYSLACLPVLKGEQLIGLLYLENYNIVNAFSAEKLRIVEAIAPQIAISLRNAYLYENLERSVEQTAIQVIKQQEEIAHKDASLTQQKDEILQAYNNIKLLSQIGRGITANLSVEKIIETVYENVNQLMEAAIFDIGIYNKSLNRLEFPGSIERGKRLPFHYFDLSDTSRLAVWCFSKKEKVIIHDLQQDYSRYIPNGEVPIPPAGGNPESMIYLPILAKGKSIGVVSVQSFQKHVYNSYHLNILRNLAVYISIALENAEAYRRISSSNSEIEKQKHLIEKKNQELAQQKDEIEQMYRNVKLLGEIGQAITSSLSVETIIETVYENVNSLMDASVFWIGLYNEKAGTIDFQGAKEQGETLPEFSISLDENRLGVWCFKNGKEILINDFQQEYSRYIPTRIAPVAGRNAESIIYLPLIEKDGVIGVITVQSFIKNAYTHHHVNILRNLGVYAAIALENALLYEKLEDKVRERTAEVVKQKQEIELKRDQIEQSFKNIKLLSEIGLDITTSLSTDKIIETVYENVNALMDASAFAIGICNEKTHKIEFRGAIEKGERLPVFYHPMEDEKRFSVWAIKNQKEVLINDYALEYNKYIPEIKPPEAGEDPESIIYLPLLVKERAIGVITVQSFVKNAYNEYHLDMLRNMAIYIAIALENSEAYSKIEQQKEEIQKSSQKITSSINYARRIQQAILPQRSVIQQALPESFVMLKPRDIVSGDFYWFYEREDKIFMAAVDCTGHGIPGAFMSMIGNDFLNEIVTLLEIESPELILAELHKDIRKALRQDETDNRDGMDMALCVIHKHTREVEFAGAKNPLLYIRDGESFIIKGDKMPIGGLQREEERFFTRHVIKPSDTPTTFYMFSDGFQDQFGGEAGRKFSMANLNKLFLQIYSMPMDMQQQLLRSTFLEWKGDENQTDDLLVIGFRV